MYNNVRIVLVVGAEGKTDNDTVATDDGGKTFTTLRVVRISIHGRYHVFFATVE